MFDTDEATGETLWELWMSGFSSAFALRPHSLDRASESGPQEVIVAIHLYMQLHLIAEGEGGLDAGAVAYFTETAPSLIPEMVVTLNNWTKAGGAGAFLTPMMRPQPVRRAAGKVGRNDPCPCGSGRKHKRCCGAN